MTTWFELDALPQKVELFSAPVLIPQDSVLFFCGVPPPGGGTIVELCNGARVEVRQTLEQIKQQIEADRPGILMMGRPIHTHPMEPTEES
jgi:hypothetical protein